jgi:hypothetical protein
MDLKFENCFGDKRLAKRAVKMTHALFAKCFYSIRQIAGDNSSQRAWYRSLRNDNTTEQEKAKELIHTLMPILNETAETRNFWTKKCPTIKNMKIG